MIASCASPISSSPSQTRSHNTVSNRFLGFGIPFQFDVAAWLWPEVGHVIAAAKADGHKVVDFIIGMRSRWQSVALENSSRSALLKWRCSLE